MPRSDTIRILHLITGLDMAGTQTMLIKLLSGMDRERFENRVVILSDHGPLRPVIEDLGIRVRSLKVGRGVPNPMGLVRLLRVLASDRPQILQSWLYHADLLGLVAGKLSRVPACAWNVRASEMDMKQYSMVSRVVLRSLAFLSRYPDVVVVNSNAGLRKHESLNFKPRRWRMIPNGFDLDRFRPDPAARRRLREELGIGNVFLIGLVARYDAMKDHATFLRAAARLSTTLPAVRYVLVGTGVDSGNDALTALIRELELSGRVDLLGERGDIPSIMAGLDVLSLSSIGEGFPNCVGEAMACGVPCVSTDVGDVAAILGDTGRVVPIRDPAAMAAAWLEVYEMTPDERLGLGLAARRRIQDSFSLPSVVGRYEGLYQELATKNI